MTNKLEGFDESAIEVFQIAEAYAKENMNAAIEKELKAVEKDNAKFDTELNTEKDSNSTLNTVEDYHEAIKDTLSKLPQTEKSKKQTEILNAGLPRLIRKLLILKN